MKQSNYLIKRVGITFPLFLLLSISSLCAQSPQKISFQAVLRNNADVLIANTSVGMQITILQGAPNGSIVYSERQVVSTNKNGLVSLEIGTGTVLSGSFSGINWAGGSYYVKTDTDPTGGTNYSISGIQPFTSVPFALYAEKTGTGGFTHYVGELYGGGIIVSVWKDAGIEKGLIASLTDIGTTSVWSNISAGIGITARSMYDGPANCTAIINQAGHTTSTAKACDDYSSGGFTDWYLPANWELVQCYNAAYIVNRILGTNGFKNADYWSSTETTGNPTWAWSVAFYDGVAYGTDKTVDFNVRAVRRF